MMEPACTIAPETTATGAALVPNCASHGLRKACARRLAEAGCTIHQIKAITGHKTDAEVHRYTAKADQVRLAHSAFEKLQDTANNPKPANPL